MMAVLAGAMFGAAANPAPAAAHEPQGRVVGGGVLVTGWSGFDYYLDRPTTQRLAATIRSWENTSQAPASLAAAIGCVRVGNPIAVAVCGVLITLAGSYALDELQHADGHAGCLLVSLRYGIPRVDEYNDDGRFCRGHRN